MEAIAYYMVHDPVGNNEEMLMVFDKETLQAAEESGLIFIGVDEYGERSVVKAADVKKPDNNKHFGGFTIVQPEYVDERLAAVVDVFDALADEIAAPVAVAMSIDEEQAKRIGFTEALDRLKSIVGK